MNRIKVIDFWAPWCCPCKMIEPMIDKLKEEMPHVTFEKINVDATEGVVKQFGIRSIPTLIFFVDGEEKTRLVGLTTKGSIADRIRSIDPDFSI